MSQIQLSPKYAPLFNIPEGVDTFIVTGGRFSAKSFNVSLAACTWAHNLNHRILYTRYTNVSGKDSTMPEFEEKIAMMNLESRFDVQQGRIECLHNDAKIVFKGLKTGSNSQTANLKSLKDFSCWILEEAEELNDFDIYEKTALSIRGNAPSDEQANLKVLILNPTSKVHWIYKHFFEERGVPAGFNGIVDNVCYIHTSYLDCIDHVPKEIIRDFERMRERKPERYEHIVLGGWLGKAEGVIFNDWEYGEFDESLPYIFGQDFGFSKDPTTLVKVAVDRKKERVYVKGLLYKAGLTTKEILEENKKHVKGSDLIIADSAEPRLITELRKAGLNIRPCIKGPDSIRTGIKNLQNYTIVVDNEGAQELAMELNNYVWSDTKSDTPKDDYNHYLDSLRYACSQLTMRSKRSKITVY